MAAMLWTQSAILDRLTDAMKRVRTCPECYELCADIQGLRCCVCRDVELCPQCSDTVAVCHGCGRIATRDLEVPGDPSTGWPDEEIAVCDRWPDCKPKPVYPQYEGPESDDIPF